MRRKTRRGEEKRARRHFGKVRGCALCHSTVLIGGRGVEWLDSQNEARGVVTFALCASCALTNYAEQLDKLHRRIWTQRQRAMR